MTMSNDDELPRSGDNSAASGASGPSVAVIGLLVVIALAVVFFLQNSEPVYIDFLFFEKRTTIRWSILMAILLGVLLDRVATMAWRRRKKNKLKN
jgi:uncharacterized integral membrane protein